MSFSNCYQDQARADAYATLEFKNTYYLAYRDLPAIAREHVQGSEALDFGCGTGRSTRFLQQLGFRVIGVDISEDMLLRARQVDPRGDYRLVPGDDLSSLKQAAFDLVLSMFTFDNIPGRETKIRIFRDLARLLNSTGRIIHVVSRPEITSTSGRRSQPKTFPRTAPPIAATPSALSLPTTPTGAQSKTFSGPPTPMLTYFTNPACEWLRNTNL